MKTKECDECGEDINPKRLKARPEARLCINCQMDLEQNGGFRLHRLDVQTTTRCGEPDEQRQTLVRGSAG